MGVVVLGGGAAQAQPVPRATLPGLGPVAARRAVDVEQPPWRGVVRVQTEVGGRCTGALVGPRAVLTAAHCLFGRGAARFVRPGSVHVLTGYRQGAFAGHSRVASMEVGAPGADGDWAVLTLETPLGTPDRILPLAAGAPPAGTAAMLGGFEQDRAEVIVADTACRVLGLVASGTAGLLQHSCAGTRGASGAPLLVWAGTGWAVAGIASAAQVGVAGGVAVPITAVAAQARTLPPDRAD